MAKSIFTLPARGLAWIGSKGMMWLERANFYYSKEKGPFFNTKDFAWTKEFEDNWEEIRAELMPLLNEKEKIPSVQHVTSTLYSTTQDDRWKTYFFYAATHRNDDHCKACPKTAEVLKKVPGLQSALFSIMAPLKKIDLHKGYFNGVLRYHLGLVIPDEGNCYLECMGTKYHWKEGESMIFDDTFLHCAANMTPHFRVILMVDFVRPLPFPLYWFNRFCLWCSKWSFYAREITQNW